MQSVIRAMEEKDRSQVLEMMRVFYPSPAVLSNGSEEIFEADVAACITGSPYLEGYIFENTEGILGYAMVAKSFSTEFGKPCIWIEDIYVKSAFRDRGLGSRFLKFIADKYPDSVLRLEVEADNHRAMHVYEKCGFRVIPYVEMKK